MRTSFSDTVRRLRPYLMGGLPVGIKTGIPASAKAIARFFPISERATAYLSSKNTKILLSAIAAGLDILRESPTLENLFAQVEKVSTAGRELALSLRHDLVTREISLKMGQTTVKIPILFHRDEATPKSGKLSLLIAEKKYVFEIGETEVLAVARTEASMALQQMELRLQGVGVSMGSAIGRVFQLKDELPSVEPRMIQPDNVDKEIELLYTAVKLLEAEFSNEIERAGVSEEQRRLLDTHLLLIKNIAYDPELGGAKKLVESLFGAEYAVYLMMENMKIVFAANDFTVHVIPDLEEAGYRLLSKLGINLKAVALPDGEEPLILVTTEILSSRLKQIKASPRGERVVGLVMEKGGSRSHIAFLAKDFNLPAVFGAQRATSILPDGSLVALQADSNSGMVLLNPHPNTIADLRSAATKRRLFRDRVSEEVGGKQSLTQDGSIVLLGANNNDLDRLTKDIELGAERFGLVRLEHAFCGRLEVPTEDELYAYLKKITVPATVRLTDFAEDKIPEPALLQAIWGPEGRTFIPVGGIRTLFSSTGIKILKIQIRAILRAHAEGAELQILLPMITGPRHPRWIRELVNECQQELYGSTGIPGRKIMIGAMIELPSAVWNRDEIAQVVDFFSIGTNDLEQFTFGVPRNNPHFANYVDRFHPGFLKQLKAIADCGKKTNIPVKVCGGMAADPLGVLYLIGIGITDLSMPVPDLPFIKYLIRSVTASNCRIFSERLLEGHWALKIGERDRDKAAEIAKDTFTAEALEHIYWMAGAGA